jgi:hypothetical protein
LLRRHADASVLHRERDPAAAIFVSLAGIVPNSMQLLADEMID